MLVSILPAYIDLLNQCLPKKRAEEKKKRPQSLSAVHTAFIPLTRQLISPLTVTGHGSSVSTLSLDAAGGSCCHTPRSLMCTSTLHAILGKRMRPWPELAAGDHGGGREGWYRL